MAYEKLTKVEVHRKDLYHIYGLMEKLGGYVDDPYLDEMKQTMLRVLKRDKKQHETMD